VSFYCVNQLELLVITHNIPTVTISEKK